MIGRVPVPPNVGEGSLTREVVDAKAGRERSLICEVVDAKSGFGAGGFGLFVSDFTLAVIVRSG